MEEVQQKRGETPHFVHIDEVPFCAEHADAVAEEPTQDGEDLDAEFDRIDDMSKEDLAQLLNEDLVAGGRAPVYSAAMISAMNAAALRKSQKARKKKRK
ncbi:hypothetical protein LU11_gp036 [Pseudomonas phage Lu11]|uniref:hypothetical protein n=1 Tax=Pseudomonas phage Lu11 TaxID=1161927 RepID=UPI00025F14FE|nr:hypothetical protein LU11_gp036 [Pseudomonas phage Lu11]AFH14567.1 hypothetical protein Lu11_0036 [Pseudomonas phage Lu11]